jgi:ribosomal protein L40E
MDISKFGILIIALGILIAAFGALKYLTNLDEKFDSSKSPPSIFGGRNDLGEALRVEDANMRHRYEREQATPYFIGGAIVAFVGLALFASGKKKEVGAATIERQSAGAKFCSNCGAKLDSDAVFCGNCGTKNT